MTHRQLPGHARRSDIAPQDMPRRRLIQSALLGSACFVAAPVFSRAGLVDPFGRPIAAHLQGPDGEDIAWVMRDAVLASLNLIPTVGGFLSYLSALFIPSPGKSAEQMWREYTDEKISSALFALVQANLIGLTNVSQLYNSAVSAQQVEVIRAQSIAANTSFVETMPSFALTGEEVALLPLYVIAASLHLALLRDMVLSSEKIGLTNASRDVVAAQQQAAIKEYTAHVDKQAAAVYDAVRRDHPGSEERSRNSPLSELLQRRTELQQDCLDIRDTWHGFDAVRYPGKVKLRVNRELFTGIIGPWDRVAPSANRFPDWAPPASPLRSVEITRRLVSNIELAFLGGVRMRYEDGTTVDTGIRAESDKEFTVSGGDRIIDVQTHHRTVQGLVSMKLVTQLNREHKVMGRENNFDVVLSSQFPGHCLSSIHIIGAGTASAARASGCCVLGYQLLDQEASVMSEAMFERLAPRVPPHLLRWMVD